jgi:hypothetical protein
LEQRKRSQNREITYHIGWKKGTIQLAETQLAETLREPQGAAEAVSAAAVASNPRFLARLVWREVPVRPAAVYPAVLYALPVISLLVILILISVLL